MSARGYVAVKSQPHFIYKESVSETASEALNNACLRFGYASHAEARADGWRTEWCEVVVLTEPEDVLDALADEGQKFDAE